MAANFNPLMVLKLMGWVMSNVFHRLYQAVFLNEKDLAVLRKAAEHHCYMPGLTRLSVDPGSEAC